MCSRVCRHVAIPLSFRIISCLLKVKYIQALKPRAAIVLGQKELKGNFVGVDDLNEYLVSEVVLAPGRLGSPVHGRVTATILRKSPLVDLVPEMQMLRTQKTASAATLVSQISPDMLKGWRGLMPEVAGTVDAGALAEQLQKTRDAGLLPPESEGVPLPRVPDMPNAAAQARVMALAYWMQQRSAKHGFVDASADRVIHLDGSVSSLHTGMQAYLCTQGGNSASWTQLLPIHKLAIQGYSVSTENLAVTSSSTADSMACSAMNMHVVFAAFLAFCAATSKP